MNVSSETASVMDRTSDGSGSPRSDCMMLLASRSPRTFMDCRPSVYVSWPHPFLGNSLTLCRVTARRHVQCQHLTRLRLGSCRFGYSVGLGHWRAQAARLRSHSHRRGRALQTDVLVSVHTVRPLELITDVSHTQDVASSRSHVK